MTFVYYYIIFVNLDSLFWLDDKSVPTNKRPLSERMSDLTASKLSELSHKDVPWISAENGKPLDYESVFYRTKDTSVREYDADAV